MPRFGGSGLGLHTPSTMLILVRTVVKRLLMDRWRWFLLPGRRKQDMQLQVIRIYILRHFIRGSAPTLRTEAPMPHQDFYDRQALFSLPSPPVWSGQRGAAGTSAGWGPDLTVLMAMGMAHRRPLTRQDLAAALDSLDLPTLPCTDVVCGLLRGLVRSDALRVEDGGSLVAGFSVERLTPGGQALPQLTRAMTAPLEGGAVVRMMIRVRMAFLDLLAPVDRVRALERMLLALEVSAEGVSGGFEEDWSGPWGNRWILRDLAAATDDIRQLRSLLDEARAVERCAAPPSLPDRMAGPSSGLLYAAE